MSEAGIVIIGAGHAGVNAAIALRSEKYTGPIHLMSEEANIPYHRPPLSKTYIKGEVEDARILLRPENFYEKKDITLQLRSIVTHINPGEKNIELNNSHTLPYKKLIIATGTRARPLPLEGCESRGIVAIRTLADARHIRDELENAENVVVIGGGFIGLEFAAAVKLMGKTVTVLEAAPRLLGRSVGPQVSEYVLQEHRNQGINIVLGAMLEAYEGQNGQVSAVTCSDGSSHPADLVLVGIGAVPNDELAKQAGLVCENGIVVDSQMRTSDPDILAIGDVAFHQNAYADDERIRLESIQNANDQAKIAAKTATGNGEDYHAVPWFWSDQGDMKLQMTGLSRNATQHVLRGNPEDGKFSLFHYRDQTLIAVDSINMPADHMAARKLLEMGISPSETQVTDPGIELKSLLQS